MLTQSTHLHTYTHKTILSLPPTHTHHLLITPTLPAPPHTYTHQPFFRYLFFEKHSLPLERLSFCGFGLPTPKVLPFSFALTMITQTLVYSDSAREEVTAVFQLCHLSAEAGTTAHSLAEHTPSTELNKSSSLPTPHSHAAQGPVYGALHISLKQQNGRGRSLHNTPCTVLECLPRS